MNSIIHLAFAFLTVLVTLSACEARSWRIRGGFGVEVGRPEGGVAALEEEGEIGEPCVPDIVRTCGEKTLVSGPEVEELSEAEYGPNVCRYTFTFEVNTFLYELKRSPKCEQFAWKYFAYECPLYCSCTSECSDATVTLEKEVIECCDGYTTQRPTPLEIATGNRSRYSSKITTDGCPVPLCPDEVVEVIEEIN